MKEKVIKLSLTPGAWSTTVRMVQKTGSWRTVRPIVDEEKCVGCALCQSYCPEAAIKIEGTKKQLAKIDYDYCKGCGICANECPQQAITMVPEIGGD